MFDVNPTLSEFLSLLLGLAAALGPIFAFTYVERAITTRLRRRRGIEETTEQRISKLTKALSDSAKVIDEMGTEIKERQEVAQRLQSDIDTYNKLKEVNREEVEAVAQVLGTELRKEGRRSFWVSFAMNVGFFLLGVASTIGLSLFFGL